MMDQVWKPLIEELERWQDAGRVAELWWRDDDAIEPTPALDQLVGLTNKHSVPLTLAVIPAFAGEPLAYRLSGEKFVTIAVHGWSHENHAVDRKKQELGTERPADLVIGQLQQGLIKLRQLFPKVSTATMVPPWNRIDPVIREGLASVGYQALSVFGAAKPQNDHLQIINTHADLMDWHGTRGCRPFAHLVSDLVAELRNRFDSNDEPIGILSHHLVHDAAAWEFLDQLFSATTNLPSVNWVGLPDLMRKQA